MHIVIDGVIFQLQAGYPRGVHRVWRELLPRLAALGRAHRWTLLARGTIPDVLNPNAYLNLEVVPAPKFFWGDAGVSCEVPVDVFISTYYTRMERVPNLLMVYDLIPEALALDPENPEWRMRREAALHADRFVCISQATADDLASFYRVAADRIAVAHPAPAAAFYRYDDATREQARARWAKQFGLRGPFYLTFAANAGYKRFGWLRAILADYWIPTVVVGGQYSDAELRDLYNLASALIAPSAIEGFDLPVAEALACGCPVVASDIPAHREVAGDRALYFETDNAPALLKALGRLADFDGTRAPYTPFALDAQALVVIQELERCAQMQPV